MDLNRDLDADALRALSRSPGNVRSIIPDDATALVHGTSDEIDALSSDASMGVSIPGSLTLRRNTEYCQWQELQRQDCQTCTRTVRAKDGSTKEESYKCNCVTRYDYVKAWRSRRINSMLFDQVRECSLFTLNNIPFSFRLFNFFQLTYTHTHNGCLRMKSFHINIQPGAHYNPQRDPMPSRLFVADATLTFHSGEGDSPNNEHDSTTHQQQQHHQRNSRNNGGSSLQTHLNPYMLSSGIRNQAWRRVDFVPNGMAPPPSFFSRWVPASWMVRNTRYEPLQLLRDTTTSLAATQDNFVYVGQGGYFFSPYESAMTSQLMNYFMQYLEGSLFDWQLGDLMPSCTAGDVRFSYEVQDPSVVSVLGQLQSRGGNSLEIRPRIMDGSTASLGLVHSGSHSAEQMLIAEDNDSRNAALIYRGLLLAWSLPASRLMGVSLGREMSASSLAVQTMGVLGIFATLLGGVWVCIWGTSFESAGVGGGRDTVLLLVMGGYFVYLAFRSSVRRGIGRRWHAVWCRILGWANTPPEWRVEDTYVVQSSGGENKTNGKSL